MEDDVSSKNDAIPTWSGFSYQGKVTLFYMLYLINNNNDYAEYAIELELQEDFVVYKGIKAVSFHQVKAVLSQNKVSGYLDALRKLHVHRDASGFSDAQCFLISAIDIVNWSKRDKKYTDINLFKYNNMVLSITNVPELIEEQIDKYICGAGNKTIIYLELCRFLDERVAEIHDRGKERANYKIKLTDIVVKIAEAIKKSNEDYYARLKENIYIHLVKHVQNALAELCHLKCKRTPGTCTDDCGAKKHLDDLLNMDIMEYAKIVNPHETGSWLLLDYPARLSDRDYRDRIFSLLSYFTPREICLDDSLTFINNLYYDNYGEKIIPTLLNLDSISGLEKETVSYYLQKIANNGAVSKFLNGNIITATTNGQIRDTYWDKFTSDPIFDSDPIKRKGKITAYYPAIGIIDRDKLIAEHQMHAKAAIGE